MGSMIVNEVTATEAAEYLQKHDPMLAPVIKAAGLCTIRPHKNYYEELVDSIISQQLSIKASATIFKRFKDLFGNDFPSPKQILGKSVEEFRSVGLSRGKATYALDLAQHVMDGKIAFDHLDKLSNNEVVQELTSVKGIGEWTAHMF